LTTRGICEFCDRPVTNSERGAFRVRGWECERSAGGANKIVGKERQVDRIAHATCVETAARIEQRGLVGQQELLGE
jgi:hypothetical protein